MTLIFGITLFVISFFLDGFALRSLLLIFGFVLALIGYLEEITKEKEQKQTRDLDKLYKELEQKRLDEERIENERIEKERLEIAKSKKSWAELANWLPEPWKDRTKRIHKLLFVRLGGYYDWIEKKWHDEPMELKFSYDKTSYYLDISREQASMAKNNLPNNGELLFYKEVAVKDIERKMLIFFHNNNWYYTFDEMDIKDAIILVEATYKFEKERLQREVEQAKGLLSADLSNNEDTRVIPEKEKIIVWNRDGGKCVQCGSQKSLEFDHVIPFSKGGSNTARNIQILCQDCNRKKRDRIG